eukprot:TRINITY_DN15063_c0_g1_i1.p1 TRINITY_DN15063_c0_g1~~TRINITY_DN15063_c0_g1_i1.p1  ORF type:complete len:176 (-),score=5.27 TRINITY_DN15063_c0_g1_i1:9-536(-)
MNEYIVQGSGWVGLILTLSVAWMPTKTLACMCGLSCNATYVFHYALIGAWGGIGSQVVGCCNQILGYLGNTYPKAKRAHQWLWLTLVPIAYLTAHDLWDVLPLSGTLFGLVAMQQNEMIWLRTFTAFAQLPWIPYSLHVDSPSTLITTLIYISMLVFNIFMQDLLPSWRKEKKVA